MAEKDGQATLDSEQLDPETFEMAHEELRTTFEYQVQRLREIDGKAIEILKANLLLIGIVVTGGSILVQVELEIGLFLNPFTIFGGLLLLLSTGLAAVTYTASNLRGGLGVDAVETAITAEATAEDPEVFQKRLLRSYARWIEFNARVTAINDLLATVTVLLVFVAFVYIVAGIALAPLIPGLLFQWLAFAGMTLIVGAVGWRVFQMDHLEETEPHSEVFDGIRLSKGASRQRGLADLRVMFARPPTKNDDDQER